MLLHFVHTLTRDHDRVHSFVFGTRLSNVTRYLRERDVDDALEKVARGVADWSGGTRIGQSLREFNRVWSRRVLSQGAVVLLITDGLDRDVGQGLRDEMDRLKRSCPTPRVAQSIVTIRRIRTAGARNARDAALRARAA